MMRTIGELMNLAVEAKAPLPDGPLHKLEAKGRWFPRNALWGAFTPYFASDSMHWFHPGTCEGPFCPSGQMPGEYVGVYPDSLEAFAQNHVRTMVHMRIMHMVADGEIKPLSFGLYPLQWDEYWQPKDIAHFELTDEDFTRVCAAIPLNAPSVSDAAGHKAQPAADNVSPSRPTGHGITTGEVAMVFSDIGMTQERWQKALEDASNGWLDKFRVDGGARGNNSRQSTWNAFAIAVHACSNGRVLKTIALQDRPAEFNTRFHKYDCLRPYLEDWNRYYDSVTG